MTAVPPTISSNRVVSASPMREAILCAMGVSSCLANPRFIERCRAGGNLDG